MPVKFDEYEAVSDEIDWAIDPDSNAYTVLSFLATHPETGFKPAEIHQATDIPRGSVGTTLRRLEERKLIRHKEPYWAANDRTIETWEAVLTSLRTVEESTAFEWGEEDPDEYRIGLETVTEEPVDEND